jgi:glyoxylase-like metal-dependent hydrolase (beta-lactamase superfamily II)
MAKRAVVSLAPGLWRIPLISDFVNGFMFKDDDGQITLLDMGVKKSAPRVLAALTAIGSGPSDVTRLVLSHAHPDHAGGAAAVAAATGQGFAIHAEDADYARSGRGPQRDHSLRLGRLMDRLAAAKFDPVPVSREMADGEVLPVAGGLTVVHTPGHSPGHCSFLHEPTSTLITSDAIFNVRGIRWPVKAFCTDFRMTTQTAQRLAELPYDLAAFTHGPELRERPREQIRAFLARG